ncbi:small multidrug efflux protein [Agrococcus sp. Ld7]|uniref:small multidrug efflux protein n=1 Tax=Agrococcus sp. Ld7 TaxID=649148 RepID=UPI003865F536
MNPIEELVQGFQSLVAQVPEFLQPVIVTLAGAVPFIEGEGAAAIGIVGGINPILAGVAGAIGNFLAVTAVVMLTARSRQAIVARRGSGTAGGVATLEADESDLVTKPESKGKQRLKRWVVRFGVPGASLLGPAAIPTHFTAAMLVGSGVSRGWVLLWQAIAIVLWTTVITTAIWLGYTALLG